LTGAYNRRNLEKFLAHEFARAARSRHSLTLILLDIDHFKSFDDMHGHAVGDQILQTVVQVLRENLRGADVLARYGGDEFAVVLPETDLSGAHAAGEKLRGAIAAYPFPDGPLTISLGVVVADVRYATSREELFSLADHALYQAKARGGDSVQFAFPTVLATQPA